MRSKCYECNGQTQTLYWHHDRLLGSYDFKSGTPITHVNYGCKLCTWQSYKTAVPAYKV